MAGSITDWDSKTVIGSKSHRGPTVTKDGAALNAARRSGAAIETDKKGTGNHTVAGVDHAKIAKLDREVGSLFSFSCSLLPVVEKVGAMGSVNDVIVAN